ncbi:zinc finger CCCH domain-containing protein 13-like [Papaver somniferum]|uniref:zinc finger CCCH domain-containing protein 13-like n=1 Tax=Papaver somniferum TaxID=3469 RepID=UPI000E6FC1F7|nr:zinc finger CCCH domain-containing protein 13-like [Papaver somniferum]
MGSENDDTVSRNPTQPNDNEGRIVYEEGSRHTTDLDTMEDEEQATQGRSENSDEEDNLTIQQLRERIARDRQIEREIRRELERSRARDAEERENARELERRLKRQRERRRNRGRGENPEHEEQRYDGSRGSSSERERQRIRRETSVERDTSRSLERSMIEQRALEAVMQRDIEQTNTNQAILQQLEKLKTLIENNGGRGGKMKLAEAIEEAERSPFSREIHPFL